MCDFITVEEPQKLGRLIDGGERPTVEELDRRGFNPQRLSAREARVAQGRDIPVFEVVGDRVGLLRSDLEELTGGEEPVQLSRPFMERPAWAS